MSVPSGGPARPYLASFGVLLGAGIVSLSQRLLSVGLVDLRGALGLSVAEAAWIPTACDMALMFMGAFSVYLGGLLGVRRVLLVAGTIFALVSFLLPWSPGIRTILALQVLVGLTAGTFYPLSLGFALRTLPPSHVVYVIGVYSLELLSTLCIGTPLQAWLMEHASWHWTFWTSGILTCVMLTCVALAVPSQAAAHAPGMRGQWRGFLYGSLGASLLVAALEQGERLNWFDSGTIVGLAAGGALLLGACIGRRILAPNPLVHLGFLRNRNLLLLGVSLFSLRFVLLDMVYLVPGFLGAVQGYRALETGRLLAQLAWSVLVAGTLAGLALRRLAPRWVAAMGFGLVALGAIASARVTDVWTAESFQRPQAVAAMGFAFMFVGVIGMIAQQVVAAGQLTPVDALTFSAFFQVVRLFGGQCGTTLMQRLLVLRTRYHVSSLDLHVSAGSFLTEERLRLLTAGQVASAAGLEDAQQRAGALLAAQLARQATVRAYSDGFLFVAWVCATAIALLAAMRPIKNYFNPVLFKPPTR